jgi:hypothetical protein
MARSALRPTWPSPVGGRLGTPVHEFERGLTWGRCELQWLWHACWFGLRDREDERRSRRPVSGLVGTGLEGWVRERERTRAVGDFPVKKRRGRG